MFSAVVIGAVRRRTGQAVMVLVLTGIAAATAAAAPFYGLAVASHAAATDVAGAPAAQRVLSATRPGPTSGNPPGAMTVYADEVGRLLPVPGTPVLGLRRTMVYTPPSNPGATTEFAVVYRDGFCDHARLTGACPAAPGDAAVSADAAARLHLAAGDTFVVRTGATAPPVWFRVVGTYAPEDPAGAYWSDKQFLGNGQLDPFFTAAGSFTGPQLSQPTFVYDLVVPDGPLRGDDGYDLRAVLAGAVPGLAAAQVILTNPTGRLLTTIERDRGTILRGLLIALIQALLLGWFAIGLAGRATSRERAADAGLLKLRGNTRLTMLRLAVGQHLIPLTGGAVAGLAAGILAGRLAAGRPPVPAELPLAFALSGAAVAVVLIGGLTVLAVVDTVMLRRPVAVLLRRVPSGRRGWRADVVDLGLVAVAAGAVYQSRAGGPDSGLGVVAPALVALAVALLLARVLRWGADRAGGLAVRRGRLRFGLTAVQVSRQPGADRVFALIAVAVAMFTLSAGGEVAGRTARAERSQVELGADRVLTVRAANRTQLELAVRHADPGGRQAMAVVVDRASNPPSLAVDSTRLAAVAAWRPEYGPAGALAAAVAAARVPAALPPITGGTLTLRARNDRAVPAEVDAILQNAATGAPVTVAFRAIRPGDQAVPARVTGCAGGCRLDHFQLFTPIDAGGVPVRGPVTIRALDQSDPPAAILGAAQLADVTRWYTDFTGLALRIGTTADGLTMAAAEQEGAVSGDKVYVTDGPLPLPIVLAGTPSPDWRFDDPSSYRFGTAATPVRVAAHPAALPVLGPDGIMVDLDAARLVAGAAESGGTFQVWLAPGTPSSTVDALRADGLTVVGDDSAAAAAARLAQQGEVLAARFGLFSVAAGLLLAAAMIAVSAAVQRAPYAEELRALRVQGLRRRVAVAAGYAGTASLAGTALAGGLLAALVAGPVAGTGPPPFADGWRLVPPPGALGAVAFGLAALVALIALGLTGWLSVRPLARNLSRDAR